MTEERHDEYRLRLRSPPTLVPPVLLLLLAERPGHGYELVERLKDFGFPESSSAGLYRELQRLEEGGFARSYWQATQRRGPARRVYELTPSGLDALHVCAEDAEQLSRMLQRYRQRARAVRRRSMPARGGQHHSERR